MSWTIKPAIIKKQMAVGCLFTRLVLTAGALNTPASILSITLVGMSQAVELGNVKRKSRMLISINGLSGIIVKCSSVCLTILQAEFCRRRSV